MSRMKLNQHKVFYHILGDDFKERWKYCDVIFCLYFHFEKGYSLYVITR